MKKKKILTEVFVLFFIAALFMAVYVVIEMGNDWLAVLGGAAVLLIAAYLLIDYWFEAFSDNKSAAKDEGNAVADSRLDEIEEVQKAVYTVIKRGNAENAELLQKIEACLGGMTQVLERIEAASYSQNAEEVQSRHEIQQLGKDTLDAVKEFRQNYQTGVKNLIKYEKENAKQIAETAHTNTEMTIMEIGAQLAKVQECLQLQRAMYDSYTEDLLPVLEDAAMPAEVTQTMATDVAAEATAAEDDADGFDAEAAIKAYMIEKGYVDVEGMDAEEEAELIPEAEPQIPPQKSEEEIASTLQSMASGDPNRALTPEEIAAMFAAVQ